MIDINQIKPFLNRVMIVFAVIIIIALLYWWFAGPHTKERLEINVFVTGAIAILLGVFMRTSSREGTYGNILSQPYFGSQTTMEDRRKQSSEDMERSWSDLMILSVAGILAILLSGIVHVIG